MEFGLFTEFHSPPGVTEAAAFDESLAQMKAAEDFGFDAVRLAEIHFQKDRSVLGRPSSSPPPWQRARGASRSGSPSRSCR
jgi:alkanesulfonate monooxygenase SsuD/methylene tetrahydromethanopterin reductase-like flavin-dependent oxidoreductase (luciferase family)